MSSPTLKLLAVTLLSGALGAQTLYVDAVNGLPTNSGARPSTALKSITQAAAVVTAGGTIVVLPGTYDVVIEGSFPILFNSVADVTIIAAEGPSSTFGKQDRRTDHRAGADDSGLAEGRAPRLRRRLEVRRR